MIETMNKLYLVIRNHNTDDILRNLQKIGVVHIEQQEVNSEIIESKLHIIKEIESYNRHFKTYSDNQKIYQGDIKDILNKHFEYRDNVENLNQEEAKLLRLETIVTPWGNVTKEALNHLFDNDIFFNYYILSQNKFDNLDLTNIPHEIINQIGDKIYLVTINQKSDPDHQGNLPIEQLIMPELTLPEIRKNLLEVRKQRKDYSEKNEILGEYYNHLQATLNQHLDSINFTKAQNSLTDHHESFSSLIGWIPENKSTLLETELNKDENLVYIIDKNVSKEDIRNVPILLKNNKFNKLFEPITKLFMLPTYMELDLTPFFAPFFVLFFGMCLGDAGYGIFIFIACAISYFKFKTFRPLLAVGMFLGLATTFWGIVSGTFIGINVFNTQVPIMSKMAVFTSDHMFYLALMIGLFQILFGTLVQAGNKFIKEGPLAALSPVGFFIFFIFMVLWYLNTQTPADAGDPAFKIGYALMKFSKSMSSNTQLLGMGFGLIFVMLFNDINIKIYLRPLTGLWALYNALTGFLGDLLSYIRLFALGISSAILGFVINSIGAELLNIPIPVFNYILFILFVTVGHLANLGLAALGSFVHPLRLTFVEFYKNAGFEGGGIEYTPFKKLR